jgi:hypothetical protein
VDEGKAPPPLLRVNAILNFGISAESGLVVRSVGVRRSCASESVLRGTVANECRGARGGHRGGGKEWWSRIVKIKQEVEAKELEDVSLDDTTVARGQRGVSASINNQNWYGVHTII